MAEVTIDQAMQLAMRHYQAGHSPQAEQLCRLVLSGQPDHAEALNLLGMLACKAERNDIALQLFRRAVELNPASAEFQSNLGNVLLADRQIYAAIAAYQNALQIKPDSAEVHNNLGSALTATGRLDAAIAAHRTAIRLNPNLVEAHTNLGNALADQGKVDEAIAAHRAALALRPDHAEVHWNLATCMLLKGDFAEGWREFEWRLKPNESKPVWDGSELDGRTILLRSEQGLGDTLQFIRYAKLVKDRGGRVIVECQPELIRLLQQLDCVSEWIPRGERLPAFETWCPIMSLPYIFGTTLQNILPPLVLKASTDRLEIGQYSSKMNIGLVWAGRPEHKNDRNRSIPFSLLQPLFHDAQTQYFSLQKGAASADAKMLPQLIDLTANLHDFSDTAALIASLDLVISVDTSVAHLAGTMGKPVWVLLPFSPDWRWMLERSDTPWYPGMRLFRQTRAGDWGEVVERVAEELKLGSV